MATNSIRCSFLFVLFINYLKAQEYLAESPTIDSSVPSHLKRPTRLNLVPLQSRKKAFEDTNKYYSLTQQLDEHTFVLLAMYFIQHGEVFS